MAVKIENGMITTSDAIEEFEQNALEPLSGICHRSAFKTVEEIVRNQRWNAGMEKINQTLLMVAASLIYVSLWLFDDNEIKRVGKRQFSSIVV